MDRIWLKSYPPGVPAEIDVNEFASVGQLFETSVARFRDRIAYTCMGARLTFSDVDRLSRNLAAWLQSKGLAKGARVAVMMPNVLQYPVAIFGILRAGYVVVNVNPLYTPRELAHQLADSGAEAIVILENFAATLQQVIHEAPVKHVVVASMGDLMGIKGLIVNFVVRSVKKLVPSWNLPGHVKFNSALRAGAGTKFTPAAVKPPPFSSLMNPEMSRGLGISWQTPPCFIMNRQLQVSA